MHFEYYTYTETFIFVVLSSGHHSKYSSSLFDHAIMYCCFVIVHVTHRYALSSVGLCKSTYLYVLATPPNAMILSNESVKVMDLIQAGISIKLFSILVIFIQSAFALSYVFDINDMIPLSTNGTLN